VKFIVPGTTNVLGIIPDLAQTGSQIVITGTYQYGFEVRGQSDTAQDPGPFPLDFELRVNGLFVGPQHKFKSKIPAPSSDIVVVTGAGLIHLVVNDIVSLRNVGGAPVNFGANAIGGPPPNQLSVDASLYLVLIKAD